MRLALGVGGMRCGCGCGYVRGERVCESIHLNVLVCNVFAYRHVNVYIHINVHMNVLTCAVTCIEIYM